MNDNADIKGFWYIDPTNNWPPKSITNIEDYIPTDKLCLFITQTSLNANNQKLLIENWCDKLPKLYDLKFLWFSSRVNQKMFDATCDIPNLEGLWIKWSGIKNIDKITKLEKLRHLHIGSSSQIESIESLKELKILETLELEQLNKISDFSIISELTQLQGLGIDGSIWTAQKIDSLKPLENLKNLKFLTVTNSKIQDKSFDPILGLDNLIRFNCSWNYSASEFEKLKSMKRLKYGNIETSWKEVKEKLNERFK
jgi:hypothetical protein